MRALLAVASSSLLFVACGGTAGSGSAAPAGDPPADPAPPTNATVITLTVQFTGDGEGTVNGDFGRCDTTCTRRPYSPGTRIVADAFPEPGSEFAGWGGPCSGSGQCRFLIDRDTTVFVNFKRSAPPPPAGRPEYSVVQLSAAVARPSQSVAMNARGQVVGNGPGGPWIYDSTSGNVRKVLPPSETRNFVANGISASGDVALDLVGKDASGKATHHAFLVAQGKLVDLGTLGGGYSTAKAINSAGQVAGDATLADGEFRGFFFDGGMHSLGTLGGNESMAFAINEKGWVTGAAQLSSGPRHAFRERLGARRDHLVAQRLEVALEVGERGAQLVGGIGDELAAHPLLLLEALRHLVEGAGDGTRLLEADVGDPRRVVAGGDPPRRLDDASEGARDRPGEQHRHHHADRGGGRGR